MRGETGEVEIPAYEAMRKDGRLADRMLEILLAGVPTRRHEHVLPGMAETVGVSKSEVSREDIEASERLLEELAERDRSGLEILAVWIDGVQLGPYHVICADHFGTTANLQAEVRNVSISSRQGRTNSRTTTWSNSARKLPVPSRPLSMNSHGVRS